MIRRREVLAGMTAILAAGSTASALAQVPKAKAQGRGGPLRTYDEIMNEVMAENQIVGGSLAIAKGGRLVLARGYGLADAEADRPVTPATLFCIASVTKSISAIAALRLVDQKKVTLDARLVDILEDVRPPGGKFADPRFPRITLRHLLFHGSGIPDRVAVDRSNMKVGDDDGDGEGEGGGEVAEAMLRKAMASPLDFEPGSDHKYSNSGYMVVRQVIERVAKEDYVKHVHDHVLSPMEIHHALMEAAQPVEGETSRYVIGPKGRRAAARNPVNWLFTSSELVKFLATVAGLRGKPFLTPATYRAMLALPPRLKANPNGRHVGLGWDSVETTPAGDGFSKNGGKAGVSAWAEHRTDGVSWVFLLNTTHAGPPSPTKPHPDRQLIRRINQTLDEQRNWPAIDLFERGR
jgi:N-acyl-D-amino-acid deacylase